VLIVITLFLLSSSHSSGAELFSVFSFKRRVLVLLSGNAAGQAITVAISPLLTRLYSPEAFGQFGIFLSIVAILSVFATLRFERGIVVAGSTREQRSLFLLVVGIAVVTGIIITMFALLIPMEWLLPDSSAHLVVLREWGWIIGLAVTFTGWEIALRHIALKRGYFGVMAVSRVGHACVQGGGQAVMGGIGWSAGLTLGAVFSLVFRICWLACALSKDMKAVCRRSLVDVGGAWRRNKDFPRYMVAASLCTAFISQGLMVLGGVLASAAVVGQLYLAHRMLVLPMSLLTRSVTDVNFKELSETNVSQIRCVYLSRAKRLIIWGTGPFLAAFILSPFVYPLVFGDEWQASGRFAQLLIPGLWVQFAISPFGPTFWVLKRHRLFLGLSVIRMILLFAGMGAGFILFGAEGIAAGFSLGVAIGYALQHKLLLLALR